MQNESISDLFAKADLLLFKEKKYHQAETLYHQILALEKITPDSLKNDRNCIDALNSIGYCIKFRTSLVDMLEDKEVQEGEDSRPPKPGRSVGVFTKLVELYTQALSFDQYDVEANFNLAGIYL